MLYEEIYFRISDMEYKDANQLRPSQLLSYGKIDGRKFVILNVKGEYPLAYVEALTGDPEESPNGRTFMPQMGISSRRTQEKYALLEHWSNVRYWTIRFDFLNDFVAGKDKLLPGQRHTEAEILRDFVRPTISVLNYLNTEI